MCHAEDHSFKSIWERFKQRRAVKREERFLKRWGWELWQGMWIHRSGENKYPLSRKEAIEQNAKIRNHHATIYP